VNPLPNTLTHHEPSLDIFESFFKLPEAALELPSDRLLFQLLNFLLLLAQRIPQLSLIALDISNYFLIHFELYK
jgi:hypothetical protein